jgi:hypothetical protein
MVSFVDKLFIMEQLTLTKFQNLPADLQQQVLDYIEFLLAKYQTTGKPGTERKKGGDKKLAEKDIPERLKIAMQFKGDAPYPDMPISKYDWYEQ